MANMKTYPKTTREQCVRMLEQGANKNFVESVAYESGIDMDKIRGYDDGEPPKRFQPDENDYYESIIENNG